MLKITTEFTKYQKDGFTDVICPNCLRSVWLNSFHGTKPYCVSCETQLMLAKEIADGNQESRLLYHFKNKLY